MPRLIAKMDFSRTHFEVLGLSLKSQVLGFCLEAGKFSKISCPWLEDSTMFWFVENGPRLWPFVLFVLGHARDLAKTLWNIFFFIIRTSNLSVIIFFFLLKKFANSLRKDLFYLFFLSFFGEHLNFAENLRFFERRTVVACFTNTCALSPWPRAFPYLALIESVLGWSVLDLGFFCVLGLEPCVLEYTFV